MSAPVNVEEKLVSRFSTFDVKLRLESPGQKG